jgi:multiple sugar transport system ATP-binding protein
MAEVTLSKVNKHYGQTQHAVKDVDLAIADREFVALVGPSGCGKSTTLRMIAGLEGISGGEIRIGTRVVNELPPRDRDVAMVFQNYALYQHMTVYDNLAFGLRNKKMPEDQIKQNIDRAVGILGLQELLARKPHQLSGGQQQRVALGRRINATRRSSVRRAAVQPMPKLRTRAARDRWLGGARSDHLDLRDARPGRSDDARRPGVVM